MPVTISDHDCIFDETLSDGASWSLVLRRGSVLTVTDVAGGGNLVCLFHNADQPLERYNMPDTLKGQHTAHLTTGNVCYSDMGKVLVSIIGDDVGWHDTITGFSDAAQVTEQYGPSTYQEHRNQRVRSAKDALLIELGKHGLGRRDLTASVNIFSKVASDDLGELHFIADHAPAGASVQLRAEQNVLFSCVAVPHPYDPAETWAPKPIRLRINRGQPGGVDDPCRLHCEQNGRAFANTDLAFA